MPEQYSHATPATRPVPTTLFRRADLHVLPDFHGNRSPYADPHASGVISGLTLDTSFDALCRLYWRTAVAIALGARQILIHLDANGFPIDMLHVAGGHARNPLLMELYADVTGYPVSESTTEDAVLLGTAMVAATAAGWHGDLAGACRTMRQPSHVRQPDPRVRERQMEKLERLRASRDEAAVRSALDRIQQAAGGTENLVPLMLEAVKQSATLGEISDALRSVWGEYRERIVV